jgi:hypothetical protein
MIRGEFLGLQATRCSMFYPVTTVWTILATGGIGGVFALAGTVLGRDNEHRQWVRNERRQVYLAYMTGLDEAVTARLVMDSRTGTLDLLELHDLLV